MSILHACLFVGTRMSKTLLDLDSLQNVLVSSRMIRVTLVCCEADLYLYSIVEYQAGLCTADCGVMHAEPYLLGIVQLLLKCFVLKELFHGVTLLLYHCILHR